MNDDLFFDNQDSNTNEIQKSVERLEIFSLPPSDEYIHQRDFTWNQAPEPPMNSNNGNSNSNNNE